MIKLKYGRTYSPFIFPLTFLLLTLNSLVDNWLSGFSSDIITCAALGIDACTKNQGTLHFSVTDEACVLITSKTSRNTGSFTLTLWTIESPVIIALRPLAIPRTLESPVFTFYFIYVFCV